MKLTDLEPLLDPRRPLHFATDPAHRVGRTAATRPRHLSAVRALPGTPRAVSAVTAEPSHPLPVSSAVRARAAAAVRMFTGAGTGLLASLWGQEAAGLEAQLQVTTVDAQRAYDTLVEFDALHRAFTARDVLALSPAVVTGFEARPLTAARLADGLSRRAGWADGVLWSPLRRTLVAWSVETGGTRLILIDGSDLAAWVTRLSDVIPPDLRWSSLFLPTDDAPGIDALGDVWRPVVAELVRLAALGHVGGPSRAPIGGEVPPVPVTRFLLTAAEARTGIAPTDLTTGEPPRGTADIDWSPARYRETWSAAQNRRIRVFGDATPVGHRPPNEPVLVTVLPQ